MKNILNFEIKRKRPKSIATWSTEPGLDLALWQAYACTCHGAQTRRHSSRQTGPSASCPRGRQQAAARAVAHALPDRDGSDRTARFTVLQKTRPVRPVYSGPIAFRSSKVNRTGGGSGSVFYRSDRRSGPVRITGVACNFCLGPTWPKKRWVPEVTTICELLDCCLPASESDPPPLGLCFEQRIKTGEH
jgi:hypothetical protein